MRERKKDGKKIKKVIPIISGKGGVGKTAVTGLVACALKKQGYKVGVLDADITVPNIPYIFGIKDTIKDTESLPIKPLESKTGIKIISSGIFETFSEDLGADNILSCTSLMDVIDMFFYDVDWGELDYLIIDLPPGRNGAALQIIKNLPIDGCVVVSMPQKLVKKVVKDTIERVKTLGLEIFGIIENMSYFDCYDCGKSSYIYGKSKRETIEEYFEVDFITRLPLDPRFSELIDQGRVEHWADIHIDFMNRFALNLNKKF